MEITSYGLSEIQYDKIKYVVMLAEFNERLVIIKNKHKELWELPGGKRKPGEPLLKAASRELFEETGAISFELTPFGIYSMNNSCGMNFHVQIKEIGPLPDYEIVAARFLNELPPRLDYSELYYKMQDDWKRRKDSAELKKYIISYNDEKTDYEF